VRDAAGGRQVAPAQRGLGALGALIVLILAAVAAYYIYLSLTGQDEKPTCASELQSCMASCNRSATDNDSMQACERKCESDADLCRMTIERRKQ
jgi:hypothetical protein